MFFLGSGFFFGTFSQTVLISCSYILFLFLAEIWVILGNFWDCTLISLIRSLVHLKLSNPKLSIILKLFLNFLAFLSLSVFIELLLLKECIISREVVVRVDVRRRRGKKVTQVRLLPCLSEKIDKTSGS